MKAVTQFGKDYKKISTVVKNRTQQQIRDKVYIMQYMIASNPKHENAKYAKILKKLPSHVFHVWTD